MVLFIFRYYSSSSKKDNVSEIFCSRLETAINVLFTQNWLHFKLWEV